MAEKVRILIGKPGLDGHDRGALVVARALRDAGFEIIYSGLHQTPEMLVNIAIQEAVDGIGLSVMSGAHDYLMPEVVRLLRERDAEDIFVFGGGIIPLEDIPALEEAGVRGIFGPGTATEDIVSWLNTQVAERRASVA